MFHLDSQEISAENPISTHSGVGGNYTPPQILANLEAKPVPTIDLILLLFPLRLPKIFRTSAVSECANSYICGIFCRSFGWRYGLHLMASIFFGPFFLGTFYRSASLYHPQRRAIIHLKTQQKKQILDRNPVTRFVFIRWFHEFSVTTNPRIFHETEFVYSLLSP